MRGRGVALAKAVTARSYYREMTTAVEYGGGCPDAVGAWPRCSVRDSGPKEDAMQPRMRVGAVTIGAARPRQLAHFYATLLSWQVTKEEGPRPGHPPDDGWAQICPPDFNFEDGPTLNFETEAQYRRPVWPSAAGEPVATQHLDIGVADLDAALAWALEHGAVLAEVQPQDHTRVMIDPDGHPFCLFPGSFDDEG